MNILFYTPFNLRSRDTESLMQAFVKQQHNVFLLTQKEEGIYHKYCKDIGVNTNTYELEKSNTLIYFIKHTLYLIKFCRKNKIDVLYAHLETAGLPAVLAQYFIKAKVFACRHVIDEAYLFESKRFIYLTRIVYFLAKQIIVVSERCKQFMVENENVNPNKIQTIFLAYNFNLYQSPNLDTVNQIKNKFPTDLLLLTACRLVGPKRIDIAININKRLNANGIKSKLIILGSGPDYDKIANYILREKVSESVFMEGFKLNIMDYLLASDFLIHPSLSDSSSVIIKEAGLNKKVVFACSGIGDVDDYLVNDKNAILVSQQNTEIEIYEAILKLHTDKYKVTIIGETLNKVVKSRFSIESILPLYDKIHSEIKN